MTLFCENGQILIYQNAIIKARKAYVLTEPDFNKTTWPNYSLQISVKYNVSVLGHMMSAASGGGGGGDMRRPRSTDGESVPPPLIPTGAGKNNFSVFH